MRLESPLALLLLLAPVALVLLWLRRRRVGVRYSSLSLLNRAPGTWRTRLAWLPAGARLAALSLLALAIARPQEGLSETRVRTEGVALMMVVDRSSSMERPIEYAGRRVRRFDAVKRIFEDFVVGDGRALEGRPNDLIGVVAFAALAETICPLVQSHDVLVDFVESMETARLRMENATAIGDGVALAAARLAEAEETLAASGAEGIEPDFEIKSKAIILLTDGLDNASETAPREAAALAAELGVKIYAIALMDIRSLQDRIRSDAVRHLLGDMAEATGGEAFFARDAEALREVYARIDDLETTRIESSRYTDYDERFPPLAIAALALVALETLLATTALRRTP